MTDNLCSDCPPAAYPNNKTRCSTCPRRSTKWKIRIAGYGTFDFEGTEPEAEETRRNKCVWEQGIGIKWRADLARESDRLTAEIATLWDAGKGVSPDLFNKRLAAFEKEASDDR